LHVTDEGRKKILYMLEIERQTPKEKREETTYNLYQKLYPDDSTYTPVDIIPKIKEEKNGG